jgi:uncharacterized protein (TIGR02118 family)
MHKLSVYYPTGEGKTFDMEYYRTKHRDLCFEKLTGLERLDIEKGLDGPYLAVGHLYFPSLEVLQAAVSDPKAGATAADVTNYTNTTPSMQISEVVE